MLLKDAICLGSSSLEATSETGVLVHMIYRGVLLENPIQPRARLRQKTMLSKDIRVLESSSLFLIPGSAV